MPRIHGATFKSAVLVELTGSFPSSPIEGQLCYKDNDLFIYVVDGENSSWVSLTSSTTSSANVVTKQYSDSPYTAVAGQYIAYDTSGGSSVVKLPINMNPGDTFFIVDLGGNFSTNHLTIDRNGHKINRQSDNLSISIKDAIVKLVYINSTEGVKVHYQGPRLIESIETTVPVGSVIYCTSTTVPDGFIECDGSAINRVLYSDLFTEIGTTFGVGDGSTTFNLPDLRDEFIRGKSTTRAVGDSESWAIENIIGTLGFRNYAMISCSGVFELTDGGSLPTVALTVPGNRDIATFDASTVVNTDTETRPRNVALLPCIKY